MLARLPRALVDPAGFFRWLSGTPPRPGAAFALVSAQLLLTNGVALLRGGVSGPRLGELLRQLALPPAALAVAVALGLLAAVLSLWVLVWLPVRIGAGRVPRLFEVAAWSQLPQLVVVAVAAAAGSLPELTRFGPALGLASVAWSAAFVYAGVRELSRGRALPAALAYAALWGGLVVGVGLVRPGAGGLVA